MSKITIARSKSLKSLSIFILSNNRSLYSTRRLFEEASKRNHAIRVLPPISLSMLIEKNNISLYYQKEKLRKPHAIIPRLGQRKTMYTQAVIRQFEMLGVHSLNGSQAIVRSRDKLRTLQILSQNNISVPKTFFLDALEDIDIALDAVSGAPVIIKIPEGTQGLGVMLAETERSARSVLESLLEQGKHVLVQEFIEESKGSDTRAIILGGRLIAAMKRTANAGEFRANLHRGGRQSSVNLSLESERMAKMAVDSLGLQFAGVDLIDSKRGPLILEVNPSPGLEGIEEATSVNIAKECIIYLERLYKSKRKQDIVGY
ncbi:MAG: RimK family alpha-L-glutamate ligase [Spirochaetia bacterium]|nr:RimK family alpha-L-glutamate ligase [Spirochaetia bacterium]